MKKLTKADYELCDKIVKRAMKMGFYQGNQLTAHMDVTNAAKHWNIRLEDWLNADDFNFAHDIAGIYENIIREYPVQFTNYFVPRFAGM
jgi:hypothetical protein